MIEVFIIYFTIVKPVGFLWGRGLKLKIWNKIQNTSKKQLKQDVNSLFHRTKISFLKKLSQTRKTVSVNKKDKALVKLEIAEKALTQAINNEKLVSQPYQDFKQAENSFENKEYQETIELCEKVLRQLNIRRGKSLDLKFTGRKIKRLYPELPSQEVDKQFLVLKAISLIQENNEENLFSFQQLETTLEEAYQGEELEEIVSIAEKVCENNQDISTNRLGNTFSLEKSLETEEEGVAEL